jgi:rfaE bifunctional protein nucleotidyltransferase chain/domain
LDSTFSKGPSRREGPFVDKKAERDKYTTMSKAIPAVSIDIHQKENVDIFNLVGPDICESDRVITDRKKLLTVIEIFKRSGKKIVYTSGVYDLIHEGHVLYLEKAKSFGDVLIVGVDSDELTRRRKPDNKIRPIDKLETRLRVLARNRSVNILTVRDVNEELEQLVKDIHPDVAVFSLGTKDTQTFKEDVLNSLTSHCGEIIFLEPQATNSTSAKIRSISLDGADDLANKINRLIKDANYKIEELPEKVNKLIEEHFNPIQ